MEESEGKSEMIFLQMFVVLSIGVGSLFLAQRARLLESDAGRVMVIAGIAMMVATMPTFAWMPFIDRLIAMVIGVSLLYIMLNAVFGPVRYDVLQLVPALLQARPGSYRLQSQAVVLCVR